MLHGTADTGVRLCFVGDIDECHIDAFFVGQGMVPVGEAVGFAYSAAHKYAVDGMAQAFFGYRYQKGCRGIGPPERVGGRYDAEGVYETAEFGSARAEEFFDGGGGAEFFFLI